MKVKRSYKNGTSSFVNVKVCKFNHFRFLKTMENTRIQELKHNLDIAYRDESLSATIEIYGKINSIEIDSMEPVYICNNCRSKLSITPSDDFGTCPT